ncbi:hypothetical protein [Amycolatopsis sp. PS_44_ISF1]|uniref:hypothetical protein n=1 Tax=Amycolatopsis sp. PS_44_ISF1 TaxID=2974917 RepID=UPI0028E080E9|nr:hypothetical protein [Amycolatopsis sp. PS_44_ISF1]MDT8911835.1 hypothetical protein [Amycolatopsis sp. PS_44_ISF1]
MRKIVLLGLAGLGLAACAPSPSVTAEFRVEGQGTARLEYRYPGSKLPEVVTTQLPVIIDRSPEGGGPLTLSVRPASGIVTCRIVVDKQEVAKQTGGNVDCRAELPGAAPDS